MADELVPSLCHAKVDAGEWAMGNSRKRGAYCGNLTRQRLVDTSNFIEGNYCRLVRWKAQEHEQCFGRGAGCVHFGAAAWHQLLHTRGGIHDQYHIRMALIGRTVLCQREGEVHRLRYAGCGWGSNVGR
jgi:hypothetical protein